MICNICIKFKNCYFSQKSVKIIRVVFIELAAFVKFPNNNSTDSATLTEVTCPQDPRKANRWVL